LCSISTIFYQKALQAKSIP